ncbi:E3 ubiquitin-protein ligase TRIM21-like [Anoplopoma fimbria]|uniref:E3 ubiquitin-protein ligase TRIM21-like n=1 Tax=Anoplopoma fimbria TaxID=229290 RepID=UPI0023EC746E|nr:E3 ubiquitin-protein ligase TRIM21-like [Anoplopoma fimbria]
MSADGTSLCENQFLCSICLDVFTDPVSTPCGHNFCKECITKHWDINVPYKCPNCKMMFYTRPELQVNTFVSEMVAHFRQSAQKKASSSSSKQQVAQPGDVPCDVCTGTKLKALKSCLVCLVSYCETHLEPHLTTPGLKRHQLIDPVEDLKGRMCTKHDKPLELFCETDQMCVCMLCTVLDHKSHDVVPLKEEYQRQKVEVEKTEAEIQQTIQERRLKIQEFKRSVKVSRENAKREIEDRNSLFIKLKEAIQRNQDKVIKTIEEDHRATAKRAEGFIKELNQEISELKKRSAELKQLSHSGDHLYLLENFKSPNAAPPTKNWTEVRVGPASYEGNSRTLAQLLEMLKNETNKLLTEFELKTVQQFAVDVTLDPDTANPWLILSEDGKQVHHGLVEKNLPDNPKKFSTCICVLGKQSVSTGRFYFEVQVKGKTDWVLGVAGESANRKGRFHLSSKNGYWTLWCNNEKVFSSLTETLVSVSVESQPEKVGVFVDYEEGLVSFYDVDAASLIYAYTGCSFTDKLLPLFSPYNNQGGKNSAPLIICPVNHAE